LKLQFFGICRPNPLQKCPNQIIDGRYALIIEIIDNNLIIEKIVKYFGLLKTQKNKTWQKSVQITL